MNNVSFAAFAARPVAAPVVVSIHAASNARIAAMLAAPAQPVAATAVRFLKFSVTNGTDKARVHYSLDNRTDGRKCVTIYAKDYDRALGRIIAEGYKNDTDTQTDYFDKGCVRIFEDSPLYAAARARAEQNEIEWKAKRGY